MSSENLRECPFCGYEGNEVTGEPGFYEILCDKCDHVSFSYFYTKAMAISAWNTRIASAQHEQLQQRLSICSEYADKVTAERDALATRVAELERKLANCMPIVDMGVGKSIATFDIDDVIGEDSE